eukprot:TRINITY_DN4637_c2_g4_i1.p1 TRINITY_DN4637_c2_g4~~TRINITY_DN4637_c2_g4_i1.p1  ORF type:complete len:139 (-),score=0.36 TRINITY_DN4637_c2_g4_i1:96-512(-)
MGALHSRAAWNCGRVRFFFFLFFTISLSFLFFFFEREKCVRGRRGRNYLTQTRTSHPRKKRNNDHTVHTQFFLKKKKRKLNRHQPLRVRSHFHRALEFDKVPTHTNPPPSLPLLPNPLFAVCCFLFCFVFACFVVFFL